MKVHFLDDDFATNRFHELTLETVAQELNMELSFYSDPEELLETYAQSNDIPNLLFCDVNMPRMNCWEFIDNYMVLFPRAMTDIIILTTSEDPTVSQRAEDYSLIKDVTTKLLRPQYLQSLDKS